MKKIKEIEKRKSTRKKELLKRLEYEELKRGIHKTKEDYEEAKNKKYVRKINAYYEIFEPEKHLEITKGSKKEGRHTYPTKSQLEWKRDEAKKYIYVKKRKVSNKSGKIYQVLYKYKLKIESTDPELIYIKKNLEETDYKSLIQTRKEKVLILMDDYCFYKEIKINPIELSFYSKIKIGKEEKDIYLEKYFPDKNKIFTTVYGKISGEDLLKILLKTTVKMYKGYIGNNITEIEM